MALRRPPTLAPAKLDADQWLGSDFFTPDSPDGESLGALLESWARDDVLEPAGRRLDRIRKYI